MTTTADLRAILDAADSMPGLQSRYGTAIDDLTAAQADATTARADRDAAEAEVVRLGSDLTAARATVQTLAAEVAARDATIAGLKAQLVGEPEVARVLWGACPTNPGGTSTAAVQRMLDKWGTSIAGRLFGSGGLDVLPTIPDGPALLHMSWKPDMTALVAGSLDAQIRAVVAWAQALQTRGILPVVEVWHEPDVKARKGSGTVAQYVAAKTYFNRKVRDLAPTVLTGLTVSGWTFNPASGINPDEWAAIPADVLGIDLDGINSTKAYPDYGPTITAAAAWAKAHGYQLAVPEFGEPRLPSDTDGTQRAAWMTTTAAQIKAADPLYVALFDFDMSASLLYTLTTTAEKAAWQAVIG